MRIWAALYRRIMTSAAPFVSGPLSVTISATAPYLQNISSQKKAARSPDVMLTRAHPSDAPVKSSLAITRYFGTVPFPISGMYIMSMQMRLKIVGGADIVTIIFPLYVFRIWQS